MRYTIDFVREIPTLDGIRTEFGTMACDDPKVMPWTALQLAHPNARPLDAWIRRKARRHAKIGKLRGEG